MSVFSDFLRAQDRDERRRAGVVRSRITRPRCIPASRFVLAFLLCLAAISLGSSGLAEEEAATLTLSSKHLGMTSDEIDAYEARQAEPPAAEKAAVSETDGRGAVEGNEWRSSDADTDAPKCLVRAASGDAAADSFEQCIELAIRAGNGFDESARVCRVIFPEPVATAEKGDSAVDESPEAAVVAQ